MVEQDFAVAGEVVGFQGGGGEGGFRVEETAELGDEGFSLRRGTCQRSLWLGFSGGECDRLRTFSSKSWMAASVCCSSSVGFGGIVLAWENWEYLWK